MTDGVRDFAEGFEEFREETEDFLDEAYKVDISLLEEFTENKDNPRIASDAASDVYMKKTMGLATAMKAARTYHAGESVVYPLVGNSIVNP